MTKKKIRRKLKIKNILIAFVILILFVNFIYIILELPIKNIYVIGNEILSDEVVMNEANVSEYPSFILSFSHKIKKNLEENPYIASVKVKKKWWGKVYIYVEENTALCIEASSGKVILSNGDKVDNLYNVDEVPFLINDITDVYDNFVKKFNLVNKDILLQISEINYSPVNVDQERFYLSMNDGNYVYITLTKIKRLNKYGEIKEELQDKKGIVYLDSGNYIEIMD
jgi:cell division protein FtsQ